MKVMIEVMGRFGITLLLFLAGLNRLTELKGWVKSLVAGGKIIVTSAADGLARVMDFRVEAMYLGQPPRLPAQFW
jgi:hypothetical protein